MDSPTTLGRLRWLCRRGTRELDLLLITYLDTRYPQATVEEQQAFERLLERSDPDILSLLSDGDRPLDDATARVIRAVREGYANSSRSE